MGAPELTSRKWLLVAVVSTLPAGVNAVDVAPVPEPVCVYNCGTYVPPANTGPTPEQLRQQREAKDLQEAAEDAIDRGDRAYKAGDFDVAADWYRKALTYDAENQEARDKLRKASEKALVAKAERDRKARDAQSFPPSAAQLTNAMNAAAARLDLPKDKPVGRELESLNCQHFFRAVGEELAKQGVQSWKDRFPPGKGADEIAKMIAKGQGGPWRAVSMAEVQALANSGAIVIGAITKEKLDNKHGHLAFVVPMPPGVSLDKFNGRGPLLRDGNERRYPSDTDKPLARWELASWGAVRTSRVWANDSAWQWYVWDPHAKRECVGKNC